MLLTLSFPSFAVEFDVASTKVNLGGFIKLYAMYDIDGHLDDNIPNGRGDEVAACGVPLDGTPNADKDRFSMTARESRVWLKTQSQTEYGVLSTHLEGDFNADSDYSTDTWSSSRLLRLRHAVGNFKFGQNDVLIGQTWTNFMDFAAGVPVMDLAGDPGQPFVRQAQIRFTHTINKGHYFSLSAENPNRGFTRGGTLFQHMETEHSPTMPDLIAKYFWGTSRFHVCPKALLRRFTLDDDSAMAYGLSLTSHVGFGKRNKFFLGLTYGDGIGRYAGLGMNAGAGLSETGDVETIKYQSYNTGVCFSLKENLAWTLGCGYAENDEDAYDDGILTGEAVKSAFAWHTMLAWRVIPPVECALGFTSMEREVMDGREGDMMKVQSYVKYDF